MLDRRATRALLAPPPPSRVRPPGRRRGSSYERARRRAWSCRVRMRLIEKRMRTRRTSGSRRRRSRRGRTAARAVDIAGLRLDAPVRTWRGRTRRRAPRCLALDASTDQRLPLVGNQHSSMRAAASCSRGGWRPRAARRGRGGASGTSWRRRGGCSPNIIGGQHQRARHCSSSSSPCWMWRKRTSSIHLRSPIRSRPTYRGLGDQRAAPGCLDEFRIRRRARLFEPPARTRSSAADAAAEFCDGNVHAAAFSCQSTNTARRRRSGAAPSPQLPPPTSASSIAARDKLAENRHVRRSRACRRNSPPPPPP